MPLFQNSVLTKYLNTLDKAKVENAYNAFHKYFADTTVQENIRESKEEQFQEGFLRKLFVEILGYTINPDANYNLTTELKNETNSKKVDGAILINGKTIAVIELKGTDTTDLSKVEAQAFGYKNNQRDCVYVISSNFEKLRFYIDNAIDHIEFNLFKLSADDFKLLWLCLSLESITNNTPKKLKDESISKEDTITKQLYKDYSAFKNALFNNLVLLNPTFDKLLLFKKTQKLLDRFLFIFFAEDRQLLPPNAMREVLKQWKTLQELDENIPLYSRIQKYFGYMNTGHKGKQHDIYAYNGGLFAADEVLDHVKIDDDLLYSHTEKLSGYDYQSEIDVNILGHIFENSLNEIEEITSEIEGHQTDKSKSKRKKDGVFYTPKYITKYIVDNTVGKLCEEQKQKIQLNEEEYTNDKKKTAKVKKELKEKLDQYREWLLQLTICDPACGSGAFLNQALEFLITEHRYIDELHAKLFGDAIVLSDVENSILENNLFGVDLNDESVEIAKLSLWLRTAQPNRKLNNLNENIKCGNSLIDDPTIAGEKAFNWQNEFPKVFANGGFDVIIGNPPYVGEKGHSNIFEALKKIPKWNEYYRRRSNTYYFFIKQGLDLLKYNGIQSLIIPREFITADWANKVRKEILEKSKINEIVDFNDIKVFDDAGTTSLILTHTKLTDKETNYNFILKSIRQTKEISMELFESKKDKIIDINDLDFSGEKIWSFYQNTILTDKTIVPLITLFDISQGLVTGADKVGNKHLISGLASEDMVGRGIFILKEGIDIISTTNPIKLKILNEWIPLTLEDSIFIKPYIKTEGLNKWQVIESDLKVIYIGNKALTENIKNYLIQFSSVLINRSTTLPDGEIITLHEFENYNLNDIKEKFSSAGAVQKIMRKKMWYLPLYERTNVPFSNPKLMVNTKNMDKFTYSDKEHYSSGGGAGGQNYIYPILEKDKSFFDILLKESDLASFVKYTNAILNSEKMQTFIKSGQFNQLSTEKIGDLPIIKPTFSKINEKEKYELIVYKANSLINLYELRYKIANDFFRLLKGSFTLAENSALYNWYSLTFSDFIKLLNKEIVQLKGKDINKTVELEWMDVFENQKTRLKQYDSEIYIIEKEIDQLVYKLYEISQ